MNNESSHDIPGFPELFAGFDDLLPDPHHLARLLVLALGIPSALLSLYAMVSAG